MENMLSKILKNTINVLMILISVPRVFMHLLNKPSMSKSRQFMKIIMLSLIVITMYKAILIIAPMYSVVITIWFAIIISFLAIFILAMVYGY